MGRRHHSTQYICILDDGNGEGLELTKEDYEEVCRQLMNNSNNSNNSNCPMDCPIKEEIGVQSNMEGLEV